MTAATTARPRIGIRQLLKPEALAARQGAQKVEEPPKCQPAPESASEARLARPGRSRFEIGIERLQALFPDLVFRPPFFIGVKEHLIGLRPDAEPEILRALHLTCRSIPYRKRLRAADHRFDLAGEPCSDVTDAERAAADAAIEAYYARRAAGAKP